MIYCTHRGEEKRKRAGIFHRVWVFLKENSVRRAALTVDHSEELHFITSSPVSHQTGFRYTSFLRFFFFLKLGFNPDEKNVPMFTAPSKTLTTFGRTHKQHNGNMIKEMARGKKKKNADYPQCPFFFVLILSNATITPPVCFLWSKPEWKNVIRSFSFTLPNNKPRPRDVNKKSCRFETLGQRGRWSCLCLLLPIIPVSCFL